MGVVQWDERPSDVRYPHFSFPCIIMRILLLAVLLSTAPLMAQNLVVNPSFEITSTNCTAFGGEGFFTDLVGSWDNASNNPAGDSCSSPDLFSACNTILGINAPTHMPYSTLGYQYARTGTRHAGFITHEILSQYREYIQGRTTAPLQAGQTYCVSMYVSRGDAVPYATNNIGVRFTNTQYLRNPCPSNSLINLPPHLNYGCPALTDTAGWVRLQWDYTATGGEQWFVIGNFFNNANTDIQTPGGGFLNPFAYYYIDDVSIVTGSCCHADLSGPATMCVTDAAVNLQAAGGLGAVCTAAITGTWSGPGIINANAGTFDPQVAGVGTHTLTFTMACGFSGTMQVTVGPCSGLTVCSDANTGQWNVSGGVPPYSWQNQTTVQDCSACLFGCFLPPGCAVNVNTWTTFATGASIPAPSGFPIRVTDGAGTELVINSAAEVAPCVACPTITATVVDQDDVLCNGDGNGSASVSATGGQGPYLFAWSGGLSGPVQTGLSPGTYTVTATDGNGCTGTINVVIAQPPALTVQITSISDATCAGNDGSATATATGGTGTLTFAWSPVGGNAATANSLAPGTYSVVVIDANGCSTQANVTIGSIEGPTITNTAATPTACGSPTGTITVMATGNGLQYSIDGGATSQATGLFEGLGQGTYNVTVTDANGCEVSATVNVVTLNGPTPVIIGPTSGCEGDDLVLSTTQPYASYMWSNGTTNATTSVVASGQYTVTVTDANGCTGTSAPFNVTVHGVEAAFVTDLASPQVPNTTVVFTDASSGDPVAAWEWWLGEPGAGGNTPSVEWTYETPGTYDVYLIVTSANGCTDTIMSTYTIRPVDIIIPNVFSPNSDGSNDAFVIENIEFFKNDLVIMNRWGMPVLEMKDYRNQWRGTDAPDGTYFYILNLEDGRSFTGHVTLLR